MAAKFIACFDASNHGIWLQNFVIGLRIVDGKDHSTYFVIISLKYYIPTTAGAQMKLKHLDINFLIMKEGV